MDILKDKQYAQLDYTSRYIGVPFYYNTQDKEYVYGIGTNMKYDSVWSAHQVRQEDTLDSLALTYYNDPTLWWLIAYFNNISDPFAKLSDKFTVIKIPSRSGFEFGNER